MSGCSHCHLIHLLLFIRPSLLVYPSFFIILRLGNPLFYLTLVFMALRSRSDIHFSIVIQKARADFFRPGFLSN